MVDNVNTEELETLITESDTPILVDFYADWCMPCKQVLPVLEDLYEDYEDDIKIVKINAEQEPDATAKFGVRGVPTLITIEGGEVQGSLVGSLTKNQIEELISGVI